MAINELIRQTLAHPEPDARMAYAAPYRWQAKDIAWQYLHRYCDPIPGREFNEAELTVKLPPKRSIRLYGTENPDALRGPYLDGVALDEYAYTNPQAWRTVLRPQLIDRKGFAMFMFTPLGRNHAYQTYINACENPRALTRLYRASETGIIDDEELASARREMTEDEYAQEFECSFEAAIHGAYYARELEAARKGGRIKRLTHETAHPVDTWWDLGFSDYTAILFTQTLGREIHVLDYLQDHGKDLAWYTKALQEKPYLYGVHHLPHDAGYKQLAAGGKPMDQQLRALGLRDARVHARSQDVLHGIAQGRLLFPRVWFDVETCRLLLDALGSYRADYSVKHQDFKAEPLHDWASHGADAYRLLAEGHSDRQGGAEPRTASKVGFDPYTYDKSPVRAKARTTFDPWSR